MTTCADLNAPYSRAELKRVKAVKFTMFDADTLQGYSVAEISKQDIYKDGVPVEGGVNDPHLGPIDIRSRCKTCDEGIKTCPGHWGHLTLAKPIFGASLTSDLARPWRRQVLNNAWVTRGGTLSVSAAAVASAAAVVKTKSPRPKRRSKGPKKGNVEDLTQWPTERSILDFLTSQASKNPQTLARAVRHCGRQGWWQVLMAANALQEATGFQISIFASACADALRTSKGKKGQARKRDEGIDFVDEMWRKLDLRKNKVQELQYALSSSLNLCKEVSTPKALSLADELWEWFEEKEVPKNGVLFESYLRLQESQGHFDSVNDLLMRIMVEQDIKANDRTLVDLLELAAQRRDSKRADDLWHILVET
eukprot:symbB.v1.2.022656.t1/scaffold2027.1/size138498/4